MVKIQLVRVSKSFNGNPVLNNIRLTIEEGEYFCLVGPSGSGKTTTLKIIAGLYSPDVGRVLFDDKDVTDVSSWERGAAMMFQNPTLFRQMNILENVMFPLKEKNLPKDKSLEIAMNLLKKIHLEDRADAYPDELSGGMQQRVALARALASGSKLLLLDEPLGALDARLRLELREELRRFAKENMLTVVHVTQDQDEAMAIADRIGLLKEGRLIQVGCPYDIYQNPETPFVMNFIEGTNFLEGYVEDRKGDVMELMVENVYHRIKAYGNFKVGNRVLLCIRPSSIRLHKRKGGLLFARVTKKNSMGSYVVVEATLFGPNKPILIETSYKDSLNYKVNDIVSLSFDINDMKVFHYPLLGFTKEVEVVI